jgi:hypothetical protein
MVKTLDNFKVDHINLDSLNQETQSNSPESFKKSGIPKYAFNRNIIGKINDAIDTSSLERLRPNDDESTASTSGITTPNKGIRSYKLLTPVTPANELANVDSNK